MVAGSTRGGCSFVSPAGMADFRWLRSGPFLVGQHEAEGPHPHPSTPTAPATIGTGVLIRASATGPPGMLSRLRGGPVFRCWSSLCERRRANRL